MPALIIAHMVDNTTVDTYGPAFSAAPWRFGVTQMISPQIGGAIADTAGSFTPVFILSAVIAPLRRSRRRAASPPSLFPLQPHPSPEATPPTPPPAVPFA